MLGDHCGAASESRGYTLEAQLKCVMRELAMRRRCYPNWVKSGKMKADAADHEINCMKEVHDTIVTLLAERLKG